MEGVVEGRWGCGGLEVVKIDGLLMLFGHKHEFSHYFFFITRLKSIGEDRKKQKTLLIMRNDSASQGCGSGFQYWSD